MDRFGLGDYNLGMKNKTFKIIGVIVVVIIFVLLAVRVVFDKNFDEWGAGLERIGAWERQYKIDHPGATKEEIDAAFDAGIASIGQWQAEYKKAHPNATKEEMDAVYNNAFKK